MDESKYDILKKEFEDFTYVVSHDMRAPLRAIASITEWIEEDLEPDASDDILDNFKLLKDKVSIMDRMIDGLVRLSRVDSRDNEVSEFTLKELQGEIKLELSEDHNLTGVSFDIEDISVVSLRTKLKLVVGELIKNALVHNGEETKVSVSISKEGENLEVLVKDNGTNELEDFEKLKRVFYTTMKNSRQIGIGLTLVEKIVRQVRGSFSLEQKNNEHLAKVTWPLKIEI